MDFMTIGGLVLAVAAILGGQAIEGGHAGSLVQLTAGIIVCGGTIGATMVSYPLKDLRTGMKTSLRALSDKKVDTEAILAQLMELASTARRDGVLALESRLASIEDEFLKRAVGFVVDGVDAQVAREALETDIQHVYESDMVGSKVFESAGGFAPTVGILGAVLGLIHVMENLSDPSKLGPGIAVAFVATVYGVGLANLVLLPIANKLKRAVTSEKKRRTLLAEGVLGIQEGLNPRVLEEKLRAYIGHHEPAKK
jgi:chemotaxis protein MotA